ncbi:uncharacterized protein TRAVEDRAFT_30713 [Trametes versicolor FP-101664 SS1]|uniref:uncharacterized protein n=1 Tax=Trametes versicolor (strain FP-101664) TaxID=717944 RepID=UPI0004623657|nr:uncharacterized protein TRAVEDRAFT_30713 [Trametes versicolor FP-101664 SS1]EIW56182.1 hypothetical protein TRAVEDRAFT_30713 [Trametes versicolor FP-101664 SS1]
MSSHPLVVAARAPEEPHPASVQPVSSGTPLELELELREKLTENLRECVRALFLNTRPLTSFVRTQRPDVDMDAFGMVAKGSGVGELSGTHSLFLDSSV